MKKRIVVINGVGTSGKDAFVGFYRIHHELDTCVFNISSVDSVKMVARQMGWDGTKDDRSRKFLSDIKDLWTNYNDGIFQDLCNCLDKKNEGVIFIHCREPEEIARYKERFGNECVTLLVIRPGVTVPNNASDQNVFNYTYDHTIMNDGSLKELEVKAASINFLTL